MINTLSIQQTLKKALVIFLLASFCFLFPLGTKIYIYVFYLFALGLLIAQRQKLDWSCALIRIKREMFPWMPLLLTIVILVFIHGMGGYSIYFQAFLLLFLSAVVIDKCFLTKQAVVSFLAFVTAMLSISVVGYVLLFGLNTEILGVNKNRLLCGMTLIVSPLLGCILANDEEYSSLQVIALGGTIALFLLALVLSEVRTAILGLFAILLVLLLTKSLKSFFIFLLAIIVVLAFFVFTGRLQQGWNDLLQSSKSFHPCWNDLLLWSNGNPNSSWGIRLELWRLAFEGLLDKPIFGWGSRPYYTLLDSGFTWTVPTFNPTHAHNDTLNFGLSNGLFGLVGWATTLLLLFKRARNNASLLALLFSSLAMGLSERIWFDNKATLPILICLWILFSLPFCQKSEKKNQTACS